MGTDAMLLMYSTARPAMDAEAPNMYGEDRDGNANPHRLEIDRLSVIDQPH